MDTSDDKDMLMTKLSMLMFESLSICCLYQKRLVETICYSEMVKPNILLRKLKQRKKKRKKRKKCGCKTSVDMTDGREICGHPNIRLIYGSMLSQFFDFLHKTFVSKFDFLILSFSFFFQQSNFLIITHITM